MHAGQSLWLLVAGFLMSSTQAHAVDFYQPLNPPRPFQVMVQGGMSRQSPENSGSALQRTIQDGFEWAVVEVRRTKDGRHVLFGDTQVDGYGPIHERTLDELQKLEAGRWFAPRYAGEQVLTLGQCLELAKQKLNVCLDCKDVDPAGLAQEILAARMTGQILVSADAETLAQVRRESNGRIPTMPKWQEEHGLEAWIDQWRPEVVEIDARDITPEVCRAFHAANVKVAANVLGASDRPEVWDRVLTCGADFLRTGLPENVVAHRLWKRLPRRPVEIACHRGANRYAPENTLAAFEKSIQLGVDYVEFDVRRSSDGQFFVLHDGSLDRTTDVSGPISALDAARIRAIDAGAKFGRPFRSARIPSLDEALDALAGRAQLYIDAKDIPAEDLAEVLTERKLLTQSVVYQSPSYLRKLKTLAPEARCLCPLSKADDVDCLAETVRPYGFDAAWRILSKDLIDRCHARSIKVFSDALGVHERVEDYLRAIQWGIDVIQTDHPLRVIRAVEIHTANASTDARTPGPAP